MSRAPLHTGWVRTDGRLAGQGPRGASGWKVLVAVVFFGTSLVYGLHRYSQLHPPPKSEPPRAIQQDAAYERAVEAGYKRQLDALGLAPEKRRQLNHWVKTRPGPEAPKEERRAHTQKLQTILSPEQIERFRQARKEYYEGRQAIRKRREDRMKSILGERDFELHKENMERLRAEEKARKPKPTPSPTHTPAT